MFIETEGIVGNFAGRAIGGKNYTKEMCVDEAIKYFNNERMATNGSMVHDILIKVGWRKPIINADYINSMSDEDKIKFIASALYKWADIGDSYIFDLTRVKEAFGVGTMTFDDFVEWDEDRILEIASEFVDWLNQEVEDCI